jgi:plastocyanin
MYLPAKRHVRLAAAALLAALSLAIVACGSSPGMREHHDAMHGGTDAREDELVVATGDVDVEMKDNTFHPGNLQIPVGATVTWTNLDSVAHTATEDDDAWGTELLGQGESESITFTEPGVYEYYCVPHPNMRARIEVVP